jgi:hypothetical protein
LNEQKQRQQAPGPAPAPAPAPVAAAPIATAPELDEKIRNERMAADPAAQAAAKTARMDTELGRPDTAQHDRLIAELEKRKQSLAPKQGFEGLMEYLGQVSANSQPGRGSFASGAAGARGMDKLNKERQLEQFELSKQAIEVSQKKLDTVRAYAEKRFNVGEAEFDKVYKEQFEAAKETTKSKDEARKLAQENTLKRLQMENNLEVQRLQNKGSLAAANARGASGMGAESKEIAAAEAAFARDPEAKALMKTMEAYAMMPDNPKARAAAARLREIQAAKYKQFGLTLEGAPGAGSPGGTTRMRFDAQGNPIK